MYIRIFITSTFFATSHSEENTNLLGGGKLTIWDRDEKIFRSKLTLKPVSTK